MLFHTADRYSAEMRVNSLTSLIVACAFVAGCVMPPERTDPFAKLTIANPSYKNLALGLMLSENTQKAMQYAENYRRGGDADVTGMLFDDIATMFERNFKTVQRIDKIETAQAKWVDLVAVLDIYATLPIFRFQDAKIEATLILLTTDNKPIDVIKIEAVQPPDFNIAGNRIKEVARDASQQLEMALQRSVKLAEFGQARTIPFTVIAAKPQESPTVSVIPSSEEERLFLTDPRGVKVMGKAPAEYVAEQFGKSWAVIIGIDDYEKAPRLKYATADAKAMAAVLQQQGFQVAALYNQQATKAAIERELGDRLVDRVGENDRVVIFYAGHGETKTAKGGKTMGYLLPVQGQPDALAETGMSMGRIKELADALPSKQVLFLVDACYGGIAGQQFRSTLPPMTVAYLKMITRERGRQLISAGGPDQQAMESPEWGHSVFTYYLLEGLKGLADLNDDGIIPASELYSYLDSRVFSAAQMKGHTQRPELWSLAAEKGEFVFVPSKKQEQSR